MMDYSVQVEDEILPQVRDFNYLKVVPCIVPPCSGEKRGRRSLTVLLGRGTSGIPCLTWCHQDKWKIMDRWMGGIMSEHLPKSCQIFLPVWSGYQPWEVEHVKESQITVSKGSWARGVKLKVVVWLNFLQPTKPLPSVFSGTQMPGACEWSYDECLQACCYGALA